MENQNSVPISKRSGFGFGSMYLIMRAMESESEHVVLGIVSVATVAAIYIIADGIKNRKRNVDKNSN